MSRYELRGRGIEDYIEDDNVLPRISQTGSVSNSVVYEVYVRGGTPPSDIADLSPAITVERRLQMFFFRNEQMPLDVDHF